MKIAVSMASVAGGRRVAFSPTDVTVVIGADDVAKRQPGSLIYMPIREGKQSKAVIVLKRSMASGFARIDNSFCYDPQTELLFGDAKKSVSELASDVGAL